MTNILQFSEISDYLQRTNLQIESKFSDFVIYDWADVNWATCVEDLPYRSHYFEVVFEMDSDCKYSVDQFDFTSSPNKSNLFFISPYRLQSCQSGTSSVPYKGFTILFKPEFIHLNPSNERFLQDFPFFNSLNTPGIALEPQMVKEIAELFRKIKHEYDHYTIFSREIIKNYLNILLLKGKAYYRNHLPIPNGVGREQEIYNQFMSLVQQHYLDFDSVGSYAEHMHMSSKHLSETIKNISGQSALQVIHNARLHHAKSLLRQTNMTVSQIAYELHFDNPDYFSVFFKRLAGESPLAFRNS
ncbi:helix-turn-helix transcriptional regulator [Olivibacter sp. SDN3]|uniref:AraC family transcriptional regulator n=1 Tax=Olivibacter sp. SDN3 TaxID=2764720 RepID=UPI00165127BD|nr:AraC family transcriptional regulator [Olivibacter sp. SDN3]QNL51018.1 helix-turn-helix transcriptional regulator [Olivibacter sp. SDN3]